MNQKNIRAIAPGKLIALAVFLLTSLSVPIQTQARDFSTAAFFTYGGTGDNLALPSSQHRCTHSTSTTSLFVTSTTPALTQSQVSGSQCIQLLTKNIASYNGTTVTSALDGPMPVYHPSQPVSRGTLASVTLTSGTVLYNFGTSTGIVINDGAREEVWDYKGQSGVVGVVGTSLTIHEQFGETRTLAEKSKSYSATIARGGMQYVAEAGIAYSATVSGTQVVEGESYGSIIKNGGTQTIYQGVGYSAGQTPRPAFQAISDRTTIESGGFQDIISIADTNMLYNRATAYDTTIASGGTQWVKSGQANSTTVSGLQKVSNYLAPADSYSTAKTTRFGYANTTTIKIGGVQEVFDGGTANTTTVQSGGTQTVKSGGTANFATIEGYQSVNGGVVNTITVKAGGVQSVSNKGKVYNSTIEAGAKQIIASGGQAYSTTFANGSMQDIENGGQYDSATVDSKSTQTIFTGGTATFGTIAGYQSVNGGAAYTATIQAGGTQSISNNGKAYGTKVQAQGVQVIATGGQAYSATISNGAMQSIAAGGTANFGTIEGRQSVDGGVAYTATIQAGGTQSISNNGKAYDTKVQGQGAQVIASGGQAYSATISNGAMQSIAAGGTANFGTIEGRQSVDGGVAYTATIQAGGTQSISNNGKAYDTKVQGQGAQVIASGGQAYSATISNGAMQSIAAGGTANFGTIEGYQSVNGGDAYTATIQAGGTQSISNNGKAYGTKVQAQGVQVITSGGQAYSATISNGATQSIAAGGTANFGTIEGRQSVDGGVAYTATVKAGGVQSVSNKGTVYNSTIEAGAKQIIASGGQAYATTFANGSMQDIENGGQYDSATVDSKSTQTIFTGGTATFGTIAGYQSVNGGAAYTATIEAGGTQSISNNGQAYGTKVKGVQVIASGGQAYAATISNGGTQIVLNGGLAYSTMLTSGTQIVEAGGLAKDTILSAGSLQRVSGTLENSTIAVGAKVEILPGGSATGNIIANGEFVFTTADSDTRTYTGVMTGNGVFKKDGGGTLIFNSVSPQFTGTTTIAGGILKLGDMYTPGAQLGGNIQIDNLGTLRGHGTVLGNVINQGTVMPGGSIGTLRIAGDYTQASNGKLVIEMSPTKVAKLKISGTANIDGGLTVVYAPGRYQTGEYNILSADKGVNGKFVKTDYSIPLGYESDDLGQSLLYSSNDVNVVLSKKQEFDNSKKEPQNIDIPGTVVIAPKNTSIYPSLGVSSALAMRQFTDTLIHKYGLNQEYGNDVWAQAIGSQLKQGNMRSNEAGMMFGINRLYGHTRLGVALSYGNTNTSERDKGSSASFDNLRLALYGNRQFGSVLYSGALSYNRDSGNSSRLVDPALGSVSAKQRASGTVIDLTAGLPMARGSFNVIPYVGIKHASIHMGASTEQGLSGYDLTLGRYKLASTQMQIGSVLTGNTSPAKNASSFSLKIAYSRELGKSNQGITVASQDGMQFAVKALELPKNLLLIGGQFEFHPATKTSVSLGGQLGIGSNKFLQSTFNAKLKYEF